MGAAYGFISIGLTIKRIGSEDRLKDEYFFLLVYVVLYQAKQA